MRKKKIIRTRGKVNSKMERSQTSSRVTAAGAPGGLKRIRALK